MENNGVKKMSQILTICNEVLALLLIIDTRCIEINKISLFNDKNTAMIIIISGMCASIIFRIIAKCVPDNFFNNNYPLTKSVIAIFVLWGISLLIVGLVVNYITTNGILISGKIIHQLF